MGRVIGRTDATGVTGRLGSYRARDGSDSAPVEIDLEHPHVGLVVGKRGYGKSYTLGVLAEELAQTAGVTPVVVDPMGAFSTLGDGNGERGVTARVVNGPTVSAATLSPRAWCDLLELNPATDVGALVWQAASAVDTLPAMCEHVAVADAPPATSRAAANHLDLAAAWGVFDADGMTAADLTDGPATVVDVSGLDRAPMNAVVRAIADSLYRHCVSRRPSRLPWLLLDEAHAFFDGIASPALRTVLTRGRQPGVSLIAATQRPSALPDVAVSQADLLVVHRLTARSDREALARARPSYLQGTLEERMPTTPGAAVVVDDATESVHAIHVRERDTSHGGNGRRATLNT